MPLENRANWIRTCTPLATLNTGRIYKRALVFGIYRIPHLRGRLPKNFTYI